MSPINSFLILLLVMVALAAPPAGASPIEVHVIAARPSPEGTRLELTVAALVEGKPAPNTPDASRVIALTGTTKVTASAIRPIATEPRAVTVLIDTGALPPPDGVVHRAVGAFLEARPKTELLQIVSVDHEPHGLLTPWSSEPAALEAALREVRIPRRPASLLFEAIGRTLEGLSDATHLPDQRALLLLTDGVDTGSEPPWTFDFVRALAQTSGVPILSVFVPPQGRGQEASARRALAVLSETAGGRVVDLPGRDDGWASVDPASLERALLQAGALLDGLYVVTLDTPSLPAGRVTGSLSMLGTVTPFDVALRAPVIAPERAAPSGPPPAAAPASARPSPLLLLGLAVLLSAGVAFVVARRAGPGWEELADEPLPPRPPLTPREPTPDPPPPEPVEAPVRSSLDPPSSAALAAWEEPTPPPEALDPVAPARVEAQGGWSVASVSHRGPRQQNEDFLGSARHPLRPDRALVVVADGMGGHNGGYQASRRAVDSVLRGFGSSALDADPAGLLEALVDGANQEVHALSASSPRFEGCGTTLVVMICERESVHYAHVGDSRLYRLRGATLEQLTEDHSLIRLLVLAGALTAEEAAVDPRGHVLSQAVGSSLTLDIDITANVPLQAGDRFLLCSDGLSGVLSAERMAQVMAASSDPDAARLLVMDALNCGTEDNTTAQVVSQIQA